MSPPSSLKPNSFRFLDTDGNEIEAPLEWTSAWLEIEDAQEEWESCSVTVNGAVLPLLLRRLPGRREPAAVAEWDRAGPGGYRILVRGPAGDITDGDVRIAPRKISGQAYARMIEDLEERLPVSIALGLQRLGGLAGVDLRPPEKGTMAQELERLRRALRGTATRSGLLNVLGELAKDPHEMLQRYDEWVRHDRARRPHPTRLAQALMSGQNLGPNGRLVRVIDSRVRHTFDVYENRLVALFVDEVARRLRRVIRHEAAGQGALLVEAEGLLRALLAARREARFLDDVQLPAALHLTVTMVLIKRPPYRAALEGYIELHRSPYVHLDDPALESPLENVPHLYQLWGTLQIIDVTLEVATELGYQLVHHSLVRSRPGDIYVKVLPNGSPAVQLVHPVSGARVAVIPEKTYGSGFGLHSVTYLQRPDIAIEVRHPDEGARLYLFDPKYKLDSETSESFSGRPVKTDLDKMHAYRDAIRDETDSRPARYAAILYPGTGVRYPTMGDLPDVEALRAYPGEEERLRDRLRTVLEAAL